MTAGTTDTTSGSSGSSKPVRLGIDCLEDDFGILSGKRVGLITNATGVDSRFSSTIDVLHSNANLTALFAPEHGIRGAVDAGGTVGSETDAKTGLTVYSLYGDTRKPSAEMLSGLDVLVYDIQDVGARFYTYISTMKYAMQAAVENGKSFVVLDRPNPLSGDVVQGAVLEAGYESFVGITHVPQRSQYSSVLAGMTLLYTIRDMYPDDFSFLESGTIDIIAGSDYIKNRTYSLDELKTKYEKSSKDFKESSSKYRLY